MLLRTKAGQIVALNLDLQRWLNFGPEAQVVQEPRSLSTAPFAMATRVGDQVLHGERWLRFCCGCPATGAHGRVPPGLLPPLAVADLD